MLHLQLRAAAAQPHQLGPVIRAQALGPAPLDSVFADPVPKGARTDPEIAGDLNDRPGGNTGPARCFSIVDMATS